MKQKLKWEDAAGWLFLSASVVMLAVSVLLCRGIDIWYDELFSMGFVMRPVKELISLTARDVHPPLYYLIARGFVFCAGEHLEAQIFMAKFASVVPFFLCVVLSLTKIRRYFGMLTAGLFSFLVLSMPQLSFYTVEIRMYGYALFFVTLAMLYGYEILSTTQKLRGYAGLTVCSICACYTHYFACVAACMIYLCLAVYFIWCIRQKKGNIGLMKGWLFSGVICALSYLPWIVNVVTNQLGKVSDNYWILPVSWRTLGGCVEFVFKPHFTNETVNTVLAVVFFLIYGGIVLFAIVKRRNVNSYFATAALAVLIGLVVFGMAASLLIRPIFVYRYMIPALGVFWLAFAVLVGEGKWKKTVTLGLLLFVGIIGIRNFRAFYGEEMWKQVQMKLTQEAFTQVEEDAVLLTNFDHVQAVTSLYLENESYLWYGVPEGLIQEMFPQNYSLVEGEFSDEAGIARIKELLDTKVPVWFLGSGNAREEILEKWKAEGIASEEKASVLAERYWFNLYRISYD